MSSNKKSGAHHPTPESDLSEVQEETEKEVSKQEVDKDSSDSEESSEADSYGGKPEVKVDKDSSDHDSEGSSEADSDDEKPKTPEPASGPCTCCCGGCCSHSALTEPQHCVRCHRDYTFNHSEACSVPHVFYTIDLEDGENCYRDIEVRSLCCGADVRGVENLKSCWDQPAPCFMGWHTTDVEAVKDQYNGLNILRCNTGHDGKCKRTRMKHHAHYDNLYDDKVKYVNQDNEDRETYLKRKRGEIGENQFDDDFGFMEEYELGKKKRWGV